MTRSSLTPGGPGQRAANGAPGEQREANGQGQSRNQGHAKVPGTQSGRREKVSKTQACDQMRREAEREDQEGKSEMKGRRSNS